MTFRKNFSVTIFSLILVLSSLLTQNVFAQSETTGLSGTGVTATVTPSVTDAVGAAALQTGASSAGAAGAAGATAAAAGGLSTLAIVGGVVVVGAVAAAAASSGGGGSGTTGTK